ncbi:MAG: methyltransferase domain-containing protein [Wenzhouxiangellaceae bacterium]|nr:methyltransferase domain-containing protein [Wenzhouxiangellaceae bacterium]
MILDSGCGTGVSTVRLAEVFPEALIVGLDQSADRLSRAASPLPENCLLLRARAEDFWRLLLADRIRPARHYLLFPNPWPKSRHLARRWHGHPVFPILLELGGVLELRTNWRIYADEFGQATRVCGIPTPAVVSFKPENPLSPFERKYHASGHGLYRLTLNLESIA